MDRHIRVTYAAGEAQVPMIRMRGKWLGAAGFTTGTLITVTVSSGKLILATTGAAGDDPPSPVSYP